MKWCKSNNDNILAFHRSKGNLMSFYKFITTYYDSSLFIKDLGKIHEILKENKLQIANKDNDALVKTMRMTIIELI